MTLDTAILIAQTSSVLFLALWLTTGVWENLRYPVLNSTFTAEVLEMSRMREDYPEAYALVAHRRITNPKIQNLLFRLVVVWESLATLLLWASVIALALACFGMTADATARILAMVATLAFTATWAGFLIIGNWFCYWFCHEGAQSTHFQMTLWGLATMILLAVG